MDRKEAFLLKVFCEKMNNHTFNEIDLTAFLLLIREHIKTSQEFEYIHDIADLVAHRHRDKGIGKEAISGAIKNSYTTKPNSNEIKGYHGIRTSKWKKEWENLGKKFAFTVDDRLIFEISVCVMSILQFSTYEDGQGDSATIYLAQSDNNHLEACTLEDGKSSPYILFFVLTGVLFKKRYDSTLIEDPVIAVRGEYGEIQLLNEYGEQIL